MKRGIIIELRPKDGSGDFSKIVVDYANGRPVDLSGWEMLQHSALESFLPDFVNYIGQYGLASLMARTLLLEALVAPGTTMTTVLPLLHAFLGSLAITTDLVIVDPYFFAPTRDAAYPQLVQQVLQPLLPTLRNLSIVTLANKPKRKKVVDQTSVVAVANALVSASPNLNFVHKTSNDFHDRFWIDPIGGKGLIVGTSLNGLGKKYALVDHLNQADAADVITALKKSKLI